MQEKYIHLIQTDYRYFENLFKDYCEEEITFLAFREIVCSFRRFSRVIVNACLEKLLKRYTPLQSEDHIGITFDDYIEYLEFISLEQDRYVNEKDPEIRMLFEMLTQGEAVIYRRKIVEIIKEFELPISIDEFFEPLGKKEEINFNDFCCLFKATNESGEFFFETFASSFYN